MSEHRGRPLPRVMAVSCPSPDGRSPGEVLGELLAGGIELVQLRDKPASRDELRASWGRHVDPLREAWPRVVWVLNGDPALAAELGAHGVHLPERGPTVAAARAALGPDALVGRSVHDVEAIDRGVAEGVDYLVYSPVFAPSCKPGVTGVGLEALSRAVARAAEVPVLALGGMTPARAADTVWRTRCHGVAAMSALFAAREPRRAARAFVEAVG